MSNKVTFYINLLIVLILLVLETNAQKSQEEKFKLMKDSFENVYTQNLSKGINILNKQKHLLSEDWPNKEQKTKAYIINKKSFATVYSLLGKLDSASLYLDEALSISWKLSNPTQKKYQASLLKELGEVQIDLGNFKNGFFLIDSAYEFFNDIKDSSNLVACIHAQSEGVRINLGYDSAIRLLEKAYLFIDSNSSPDNYATLEYSLAHYNMFLGNYSEAVNKIINAIKQFKQSNNVFGEANSHNLLGGIYLEQKDYEKALSSFFNAYNLKKKLFIS